jgi:3-deoxy-manno-octulosonate cytidylyltransferase (CMP-KDO synthetase)
MTTQYDPSRIAIAIPARMKSKRLPGKPLVEVGGKPLLRWVWDAAWDCKEADSKFVVTDSLEIEDYCRNYVIPCYFSKREHPTGTDRIAEVIADWVGGNKLTHVINLQCDEPDITGGDLDRMAKGLQSTGECYDIDRVLTFSAILEPGNLDDLNATKVVVDYLGRALYFSRESLPSGALHVGVYGMSTKRLGAFANTPQPVMENSERLEQLRFLYERIPIQVLPLNRTVRSINTPEDVEKWSAATT